MPLRASSSRKRRLTQRNCAASSAETNGSGVRRTCLDSLAVMTAVGAERASALSPVCPPVAPSSGMVMIDMFDSLARYVETGVGCRCCEPLGIASDFEDNESTARREACCLGDAVCSRKPNWVGRDFMFVKRPSQERLL